MRFCFCQRFPPHSNGSKMGPYLLEHLSLLKSECSRKSMCCHKLSLHLRNIGELSPFFSFSSREVLKTAWKHRMDGGAMEGAPCMEGTVKRLRNMVSYLYPLIPSPVMPGGNGRYQSCVCTAKAQ